MVKSFEFTVVVVGCGETLEEAWEDALEYVGEHPEALSMTRYEEIAPINSGDES